MAIAYPTLGQASINVIPEELSRAITKNKKKVLKGSKKCYFLEK